MDTPRLIKHIKESKTPLKARDSFLPRFQSTIVQNSSNEDDDSDVIDVSSEDGDLPKPSQSHGNKTVRQTTLDAHLKPPKILVPPPVPSKDQELITPSEKIEVSQVQNWS